MIDDLMKERLNEIKKNYLDIKIHFKDNLLNFLILYMKGEQNLFEFDKKHLENIFSIMISQTKCY